MTYNVEEEHVIAYIGHLNYINLKKDIRAKRLKNEKGKWRKESITVIRGANLLNVGLGR